ncbi:hypothetical protein MMC12_006678 [Toensbergia leucococca]|nr:hypothetical protein [Toensbergia leucococca]
MKSFTLLIYVSVLLHFVIHASSQHPDTISSGNYLIVDCAEHADAIANILQMTLAHLPRAVIINTSAYQAFLKGVNPYKVTSLFTSISRGVNFTDVRISERPTLACLTGPASYWRAYWAACVELGISALWQQETQTIILCPIFWNAHTLNVFPEPEDCDIVNQENTGFVVPDRVWSNQYSILVHELVHLYFRQVFWKQSILHNEPYNVNTCMGLVPDLKEINAHNYAYYVANIAANCTHFPTNVPLVPTWPPISSPATPETTSTDPDELRSEIYNP